jgi:small subunit ribosomal protein S21|tara:strand:+ start:722 stop:910 length:189 start_codon:yes stop_codon:yes gene_type:complete
MLKIKVKKGNIERALKDYKSKVIKTRQMRKINDKKEYEKPSVKNRIIKEKAKYIEQKKREDE